MDLRVDIRVFVCVCIRLCVWMCSNTEVFTNGYACSWISTWTGEDSMFGKIVADVIEC